MLTKKDVRIIVIIFLAVIIILGGLYFISSRKLFEPGWWGRVFEEEEPPRYTPTGVRIPSEVFTYNGKVSEIGNGYIILRVRASNNYLENDIDLRIDFAEDTKFIRYTLPRGISEEIQVITGIEEPVLPEDIALNDTIEVTSRENARGAFVVRAERVKVISF